MTRFSSMRRLLGLLAIVALALAACSPSSHSSKNDSGGKVTVQLWGFNSSQAEVNGWNAAFAPFEAAHPNIDVKYRGIDGTEYDQVLKTAMSGGDGPDLLTLRPFGVQQYQQNLVDLTSDVPALANWPASVVNVGRVPGKQAVYGVPFSMETLQIFYNKDLFQKLGLSVPTTWQQFETVSDTLKAQGITPIAGEYKDANLIDFYQSIFGATRYGGEDFRTALLAGQKNLQDPNYVAALQFLKENIVTKYFPADAGGLGFADARSLFLAQKAGMFPSGFWELTGFKTAGLNVGVFNMPPVPGALIDHPLTPWYSDGTIGVNAASPNKAAAIEVAKYIATKDFGNLLMKNNHYVSVVPGVNADDPLMAAELKNYSTDGTADIAVQDLDQGDPNGWTLIADQFQQYMYGKETAQVATADIMKGLDQWWKPGS